MSIRCFNRGFIRKGRSLKENSYDFSDIKQSDDIETNYSKILSKFCNDDFECDVKSYIAYLNVLVYMSKDLMKKYSSCDLFLISIYSLMKYCLWSKYKSLRAAALRCMRYYILNGHHVDMFIRVRLDFLVVRSLDLSYEDSVTSNYYNKNDVERIQALRLVYRLSLISPRKIPLSLVNSLVGICITNSRSNGNPTDVASRPAMMILCHLVIFNPNITQQSQILQALQTAIFNKENRVINFDLRIIEAVLLILLKFVAHPLLRDQIPAGYFHKTLAPFSIFYDIQSKPKEEMRFLNDDSNGEYETNSIFVLLKILHSWPGLLYLYGCNGQPILSITSLLKIGGTKIRKRILDLLFQLFHVFRPPSDCQDFDSCIKSIADQKSAKYIPSWHLDDEFLVAQCYDCLPYLSSNRINILDNFHAILIGIFIQNNLLEALASAVEDDNESTSVRAGLLLAILSYKASVLLPPDHPLLNKSDTTKLFNHPKSKKAILWIHQIHSLLEQELFEITPFLNSIIQQQPISTISDDVSSTAKKYLHPSNIDNILESCCISPNMTSSSKKGSNLTDSKSQKLNVMLEYVARCSRILDVSDETPISHHSKQYYDLWDWDLLMVFVKSLPNSSSLPSGFDKDIFNRILKILLKFFLQSPPANTNQSTFTENATSSFTEKHCFLSLPLTWKYSTKATFVLSDIVNYLIPTRKNISPSDELEQFLRFMQKCIRDCVKFGIAEEYREQLDGDMFKSPPGDSSFSEYELNYKCSSYMFIPLGRMTATEFGEALLEEHKFLELFKMLLDYGSTDIYAKLILGCVDYTRPSMGRNLLAAAVNSRSVCIRRYSTKFLRVLLRAKVPFFASWGVNLLLKLIHDSDNVVSDIAIDVLQEACEDEPVVNNLTVEALNVLQKGFSGYMLFSRLLCLPLHFENLTNIGSLQYFFDTWKKKYNIEYCKVLDDRLMNYFTSYDIQAVVSNDPDEQRLSNKAKFKPRELILPSHPYGLVSEHKDGFDYMMAKGDIQECMIVINKASRDIEDDLYTVDYTKDLFYQDDVELELRANMLAVCHFSTSIWGLEWAVNIELPLIISNLTRFHPSLNVRGTGLLCLGLLGSNRRGANILQESDWISLRSDRKEKWPLLLDIYNNWYQTKQDVKKKLQEQSSITPLKGDGFFPEPNQKTFQDIEGTSVGYSIFAVDLEDNKLNNENNENIETNDDVVINFDFKYSQDYRQYAKSFEDRVTKSRATTGASTSSSSNLCSDSEQQSKLSKLIKHHREQSAGNASMFNVLCEDMIENTMSPHDVLGMAKMRRIQRKSRSVAFKNNLSLSVCNDDCWGSGSIGHCVLERNCNTLSYIKNSKDEDNNAHNIIRRKKFSSLINPISHLNKYRGLVVPINFNDLTIKVFKPDYTDVDQYISVVMPNFETDSAGKDYVNSRKCSTSSFVKNQISFHQANHTLGYISHDSSILMLNEPSDFPKLKRHDSNKMMRSNSDDNRNVNNERLSLRPRAQSSTACMFNSIIDNEEDTDVRNITLQSIILNHRTTSLICNNCTHDNSLIGLLFHHSSCCVFLGCHQRTDISKEIAEFRRDVISLVNELIVIGPITRKLEMSLAKLKSSRDEKFWADSCLYTEICILLSLYNFSRDSRQYIQDLFLSVPMIQLKDDMKQSFEEFCKEFKIRCSVLTRL